MKRFKIMSWQQLEKEKLFQDMVMLFLDTQIHVSSIKKSLPQDISKMIH